MHPGKEAAGRCRDPDSVAPAVCAVPAPPLFRGRLCVSFNYPEPQNTETATEITKGVVRSQHHPAMSGITCSQIHISGTGWDPWQATAPFVCPLCLVSWAVPFHSSAQYLTCSVGLGCWKTVVSSESSKNSLLYFMKYTARIFLTNPGESPPSDSIWKGSDTVQESSSLFPIKSLLHSQIHPLFLLTDLSFS